MKAKAILITLFFCLASLAEAKLSKLSQIKQKPALKNAPRWGLLLERRLEALSRKETVKPIPSLAKNPLCRIDPFKEKLLHHYGAKILRGDVNGAGASLGRFSSYLRCISRSGMRDWEDMFAKLHKGYFKAAEQTKKKGIQATLNPALMVADYLFYTGWSKFQTTVGENFDEYNSALAGNAGSTFFCSNRGGSVLQYDSPSILSKAATAIANRNGELGLGLCSFCEMASAGFEGFCDRGIQELIDCVSGAQKTRPARSGQPNSPSSRSGETAADSEGSATSTAQRGTLRDLQNVLSDSIAGSQMTDSILGRSEAELQAMACGLGSFGNSLSGMGGSLGSVRPSAGCSASDLISSMPERSPFSSRDPLAQCATRYAFANDRRGLPVRNPPELSGGRPLNDGCILGAGNGRVDPSSNVRYQYSETLEAENERGESVTVHVDWTVQVDHENDFTVSVQGYMQNDNYPTNHPNNRQVLFSENIARGQYIPSPHQGSAPHRFGGNLSDRNRNSQLANAVMGGARDQGRVRQASCQGTGCNQSNVGQANANERARGDEQQRQTQARGPQNHPSPEACRNPFNIHCQPSRDDRVVAQGGSGNPGEDRPDTCSAEGRISQEISDCAEQEQAGKQYEQQGPYGGDGRPIGWSTYPSEEGSGGEVGSVPGLECAFREINKGIASSKVTNTTGVIDPCPPEEPYCYQQVQGGGAIRFDPRRDGVIDPADDQPGIEDPCPSLPGVEADEGCGVTGPGGGDTD